MTDIGKITKPVLALAVLSVAMLFTSCEAKKTVEILPTPVAPAVEDVQPLMLASQAMPESEAEPEPEPEAPYSEAEVEAIVLTLAGECYEDKVEDKRLVCEVILNRVSAGNFGGDTVMAVVSAPNQFDGYWQQSRPVSANDYEVAEQALSDWYAGGCEPLSDLLFFEAGENRENSFRSEY